jgi:hypothetical protein
MICKQCGAEVPEGKLVCDCFSIKANDEIAQRSVEMFEERGWPLVLTGRTAGGHLISRSGRMVFCQQKKYRTAPKGVLFTPAALKKSDELKKICQRCLAVLHSCMKDPPEALSKVVAAQSASGASRV